MNPLHHALSIPLSDECRAWKDMERTQPAENGDTVAVLEWHPADGIIRTLENDCAEGRPSLVVTDKGRRVVFKADKFLMERQ